MTALEVLRSIWDDIRGITLEGPRRSWEYLVEMLAHASDWNTETNESGWIWPLLPRHERFITYAETWSTEVAAAKEAGVAFSEPLGELLLEIEPNVVIPMEEVRRTNAIDLPKTSFESFSGLDPSCGTGRFMLDAVVHNDHVIMHGVDTDVWMLRAALVNVRYLLSHTSLTLKNEEGGTVLFQGGRTVFMHADPRIVDLGHAGNWLCGGWAWTPQPWETNLQIATKFGFRGSWATFQKLLGGPEVAMQRLRELGDGDQRTRFDFDFSMGGALSDHQSRQGHLGGAPAARAGGQSKGQPGPQGP